MRFFIITMFWFYLLGFILKICCLVTDDYPRITSRSWDIADALFYIPIFLWAGVLAWLL